MSQIEDFINHLNEVTKIAESVVKNSQERVSNLGIIDAYIEVELVRLKLYIAKVRNAHKEFIVSYNTDFADEIICYHNMISKTVDSIIKRIDVLLKQ